MQHVLCKQCTNFLALFPNSEKWWQMLMAFTIGQRWNAGKSRWGCFHTPGRGTKRKSFWVSLWHYWCGHRASGVGARWGWQGHCWNHEWVRGAFLAIALSLPAAFLGYWCAHQGGNCRACETGLHPEKGSNVVSQLAKRILSRWLICRRQGDGGGDDVVVLIRVRFWF